MNNLNQYLDHTNLKPDVTEEDIKKLCQEGKEYGFYSVCVNGCHVALASKLLDQTDVKICAVVGFPLGAMSTLAKGYELDQACKDGASEIDVVINVGALKEGRYAYVQNEIATLSVLAEDYNSILKVILETCLLSDEEIVKACQLVMNTGAAFVKTSTGFSTGGATTHDVALMKATVGDKLKIKASGGIRDSKTAIEMIKAGADRIGASASVSMVTA
ncbi:MAG: deoxyribose-phosphate aldolase [Anaerovoracaceae bacterium]